MSRSVDVQTYPCFLTSSANIFAACCLLFASTCVLKNIPAYPQSCRYSTVYMLLVSSCIAVIPAHNPSIVVDKTDLLPAIQPLLLLPNRRSLYRLNIRRARSTAASRLDCRRMSTYPQDSQRPRRPRRSSSIQPNAALPRRGSVPHISVKPLR